MDDRHWLNFHVQRNTFGQLAWREHLSNRLFKRLLAIHLLVELNQSHVFLLLVNVTDDLLAFTEGQAEDEEDNGPDCEVIKSQVDPAIIDEGTQANVLVIFVECSNEEEIDDDGSKCVDNLYVFFPINFTFLLLVLS